MHAIRAVSKWKHKDQFDKNGKRLAYAFINDSGNITGKDIEIIFYDWEDDGIIDHTAIVVGTNYSYDGTGYGDLVDTHTANHCHTLWTLQRYVSDEQVDTYAIYCFRIKC